MAIANIETGVLRDLAEGRRRAISREDDGLSVQLLLKLLNPTQGGLQNGSSCLKVSLACKLLELGYESGLPRAALARGYNLSLRMIEQWLTTCDGDLEGETPIHVIRFGAPESVAKLITLLQTALSEYIAILALRPKESQTLAVTVLEMFLNLTCDDDNNDDNGDSSSSSSSSGSKKVSASLLYAHRRGLRVSSALLLKHTVVLDIAKPLVLVSNEQKPNAGSFSMTRVVVAVFESSLELQLGANIADCSISSHITLSPSDGTSSSSPKETEFRVLEAMAHMFRRSGVGAVLSQRRIHPYLCKLLSKFGIACLPRVSAVHIGTVLRAAGARQLGGLSVSHAISEVSIIDSSHLGYFSFLGQRNILGSVSFVAQGGIAEEVREFASTNKAWNVQQRQAFIKGVTSRQNLLSTLFVTAPTALQCIEAENAYRHLFSCLEQLIICSPRVLSGGGVWQQHVCSAVLTRENIQQQALTREAERSEVIQEDTYPFPLSCSRPPPEATELRRPVGSGDVCKAAELFAAALKLCASRPQQLAARAPALESLEANRVALRMATEAAVCILEIDASL